MKWYILNLFSFLLFGCQTAKLPSAPPSDKGVIQFGSGGGFAGAIHEFSLSESGYLFEGDGTLQPYKYLGRIEQNKARQYFAVLRSISERHDDIQAPGNTYRFIRYRGPLTPANYVWGLKPLPPRELTILFDILNEAVRQFNVDAPTE